MYEPDQWDRAEDRAERIGDSKRDLAWTRATQTPQPTKPMAMIGDYLLQILERCSDQQFGQDAIQFGITTGMLKLTYHLETDVRAIFAPAASDAPHTDARPVTLYDQVCEAWRHECAQNESALMDSYREAGIMEEILRPRSLAQLQTSAPERGASLRPLQEAA